MRATVLGMPGSSVTHTQHVIAAAVLGTAAVLGWAQLLAPQDIDGVAMSMDAAFFAPMWLAMIAAMMLPTIEPMFATHLALIHGGRGRRTLLAALFLAPYLLIWSFAGAVAYALRLAAMDHPILVPALVAAAGLYQLGGIKDACLRACRTPFAFFLEHGPGDGIRAALRLGTRHAAVCVGCCAGLMAALTGAGAIAPIWMAALGALLLAEKTLRGGVFVARASGIGLLGIGAVLLVSGMA